MIGKPARPFLFGGLVVVALAAGGVAMFAKSSAPKTAITVYLSPTCGCCAQWVKHLEDNGFAVETKPVSDDVLTEVKRSHGITPELESCHTALIDGYVVEGHVPADVLKQFLAERPEVAGLAVPGMPAGSPGMEGPPPQPYNVVTFTKDGRTAVYARR